MAFYGNGNLAFIPVSNMFPWVCFLLANTSFYFFIEFCWWQKTKQGRLTGKLEFCFIKLLLVSKFVSVFMRMQSVTFPLKTKHYSVTKPPEKFHSGCTPQERTRLLWRVFTNQTGVGNLVFHSWEKAKAFLLACLSFPPFIIWRSYFAKFWWNDISMFAETKWHFRTKKRDLSKDS